MCLTDIVCILVKVEELSEGKSPEATAPDREFHGHKENNVFRSLLRCPHGNVPSQKRVVL